ncbi:MAG: methylmalonyl-CoA epimerase [Planctomycetes bacterium]|nr:methylmalonyl-CoA epimerase [Planctomycetota bacterium]
MIEELDHIGIAVHSVDEAVTRYVDGLGLRLDSVEVVPTERVRVAVLMAGRTRIELLEPTAPDSPIAKFLEKRGPGVHHLAFRCADTGAQIRVLTERGAPLLDREPRPGAHGTRVAFLHPKFLGGVLAELVEHPA